MKDKENDLLNEFQKGLNVLLSIISFKISLSNDIKNSLNNSINKCYLISKKWLKEYKVFYLYDDLSNEILDNFPDINDLINLSHDIKKIIFNNMFNKYKEKFKKNIENNKGKYQNLNKDINKLFSFDNQNIDVSDIDIINQEILNNLLKKDNKKDKSELNINDYEYIINSKKIYIKNNENENNIYYLLEGNFDNNDNFNKLLLTFKKKIFFNNYNELNLEFEKYIKNDSLKENNNKETTIKKDEVINDSKSPEEINENNIKILIRYYAFKIELRKEIKKSSNNNENSKIEDLFYFLVNREWINELKNYYLYKDLRKFFKRPEIKDIFEKSDDIYNDEKIDEIYKKIKDESKIYEKILKNEKKFEENQDGVEVPKKEITIGKKKISCYYNFDIINENIFNKIIEGKNNISKDEYKIKCFINNNTFIIKFRNCNNFLLVGKYHKVKNILNNKAILIFYKYDTLEEHYHILKSLEFSEYKEEKIKLEKIYDEEEEIGEFAKIDNSLEIIKEQKQKNNRKNVEKLEFLIKLYTYYDKFDNKLNNLSNNKTEENYYLINKSWLNKYKKFYLYQQVVELLLNNE